ncbi:hypothetical protein J25TS5_33340 [Paenibacillus faecis]|uniref:RHS repeat domain-containing protein n=1 Tax=Paenibacillus faecis TaxID=862114 RepID=UPI001B1F11D7|nr:RHS repeat domain-containing protein [Paenibacillus faecis]GIO86402.1 hypothetical protein J25TS5_33340 [Paenibacillus faecis]
MNLRVGLIGIFSMIFILSNFWNSMASASTSNFEYDSNGRLTRVTLDSGRSYEYFYDANGSILSHKRKAATFIKSYSFGSKQGRGNWYYQTWDGTRYKDMTWDTTESRWEGANTWSLVTKEWLHPDGEDTVLKWVAPYTGSVRLTGNVSKHPVNQDGDGVRAKILKNNQQIWPSSGWQLIQGKDSVGISHDVWLNVSAGDAIYFILNQNLNIVSDATRWDPAIDYNLNTLSHAFGSHQGIGNWYYQTWDGTKYKDMIWDATASRWRGNNFWSLVTKEWLHPEGEDTALKWVAPYSGTIHISGNVSKHPLNLDGDGVKVKIMKNNQQIWPASGWQLIQGGDPVGVNHDIWLNVSAEDTIYFVLNQNLNNGFDATRWDPTIDYYLNNFAAAFGPNQGIGNWYYQTWDGTKYKDMIWDATASRWRGNNFWSLISGEWIHPDGEDTVLKWEAPFSGTIHVTGNVSKHPVNQDGDGVRVKIMKNNQQIWPSSGWQLIEGKDSVGVKHDLWLDVNMGDTVCFVLNQNLNIEYDATRWNPIIDYKIK